MVTWEPTSSNRVPSRTFRGNHNNKFREIRETKIKRITVIVVSHLLRCDSSYFEGLLFGSLRDLRGGGREQTPALHETEVATC